MKLREEIDKMTPLEYAQYRASLSNPGNCVACANCVEMDGFYYCETNGKLLIPKFMNIVAARKYRAHIKIRRHYDLRGS